MNASEFQIELLDPSLCRPDPAVKAFPALSGNDFKRLRDDIRETGQISVPLFGRKSGHQVLVFDGRTRLAIAQEIGLSQVPVILDEKADPVAIALQSTVVRRNLTKSGIALTLFEAHPLLREEREGRSRRNLFRNKERIEINDIRPFEKPTYKSLALKQANGERSF